ncbi:MAG: hypothetical protein KDA91_16070 [Planctomycetaceae bacterium]|nr:hypothetical protein [Planctomycetaceae bacterium]
MSRPLTDDESIWIRNHSRLQRQDGWIHLKTSGEPFERGFQHGYHLAHELQAALRSNRYWARWLTAQDFDYFIDAARRLYFHFIDDELKAEMEGIAQGAQAQGVETSFDEILAWNSFVDLVYSWWPTQKNKQHPERPARHREVGHRCSAFIATGDATSDGSIVMAHNTWDAFLQAQHFNVIIDLQPVQGQRIVMQTAPGWIASMMDFTINGAGLMITETTIDGYSGFDETQIPEFYRSRRACQYSTTIDEWVDTMTSGRNGGYANSWLLGDSRTGEIARYELGLTCQSPVERTKNGFFCGQNIASDLRLRVLETSDPGAWSDIAGSGARRVRWKKLMRENYGKIDASIAKQMIADHYDEYLGEIRASSRSLCGHIDEDNAHVGNAHGHPPFYPWGAVDGKVADTRSAERMGLHGRWGRACGERFDADQYLEMHPQYDWLEGYLISRPSQPWSTFGD